MAKRIKLTKERTFGAVGEDRFAWQVRYRVCQCVGLNITAEQRDELQKLAEDGTTVYTTMTTNPGNNMSSLTVDEMVLVQQYMMRGGRKNYRSRQERQEHDGFGIANSLPFPDIILLILFLFRALLLSGDTSC